MELEEEAMGLVAEYTEVVLEAMVVITGGGGNYGGGGGYRRAC